MVEETLKSEDAPVRYRTWCVEWFGSQFREKRGSFGHGVIITSSITVEAAKDLKLKEGDAVYAIIKASGSDYRQNKEAAIIDD